MTLKRALEIGWKFRRKAWGWTNKLQFIYHDGTNWRKTSGRIYTLKLEDLEADDWEISNPIRNRKLRKERETKDLVKLIEALNAPD